MSAIIMSLGNATDRWSAGINMPLLRQNEESISYIIIFLGINVVNEVPKLHNKLCVSCNYYIAMDSYNNCLVFIQRDKYLLTITKVLKSHCCHSNENKQYCCYNYITV